MSMLTRYFRRLTRPCRAAALTQAAGRPASTRRGTVLVLILGALAIISIVTLVYFTVGRSDIRNSAVTVDRDRVQNTSLAIADYFNSVVSDSTLATFVDGSDANASATQNLILVRKAWDYPFTDPFRRSIRGNPNGPTDTRFNPTGSYSDSTTVINDPRLPYQPWLSTGMPSELLPPATLTSPLPYDTALDWLHISNFAPDGRFVNLWNLAPLVNNQRISHFDALAARIANNWTPQAPTAAAAEMSWGLTLRESLNNGDSRSYAAGAVQQLPNGLGPANSNIPAHWTMWQQRAFRLSKADRYHGPGTPEYALYQWCDTDGDGFLDARWFELVDAFNPSSPTSLLPRDDRYRWFVAARAVDLSALVNVNTATDLRQPPAQNGAALTQTAPLGLYPSDIDLYRILRMNDSFQVFGFGYDALQDIAGEFYYNNYDLARSRAIGERSYNAIRLALKREGAAVPDLSINLATGATGTPTAPLTGDQRTQFYMNAGGHDSGSFFTAPERRISLPPQFTIADLQELLERRGVNSPDTTSRLEQTVDGRGIQNANDLKIGPFRSGRPDSSERGTADDLENTGQGNGLADLDQMALRAFDVRQHVTTTSGARALESSVVSASPVGKLTPNELPIDAVAVAQRISNPTRTVRDPAPLFGAYAKSLLPYAWRAGFWGTNYNRLHTLSYAHNGELALRLAAHLTANFGDMFDRDNDGSGYTLLIDRAQRGTLAGNPTAYPWWTVNSGKLDLTDPYLPTAGQGPTLSSPAINILGIEAQPFITQVCSIFLYTDAPFLKNGDNDNQGAIPGNEPEITINGWYSAPPTGSVITRQNADFIGQILGFQLTNPFDIPVALTTSTDTQNSQPVNDTVPSAYYLEFNGNLFKLAREGASGLEGIVLRPGETRTFYVLSNPLADMQSRAENVVAPDPQNSIPPDAVEQFIDNQLAVRAFAGQYTYGPNDLTAGGSRVKPIRLRYMDATTGASQVTHGDLFAGGNATAMRTVYLWHSQDPTVTGVNVAGRATHMLADRLVDPGVIGSTQPTLDRRIPNGPNDINGTQAGPEPVAPLPPSAGALDNTGFTIALWGSIKRPDNPVNTPLGAIPAYCLEGKPGWNTAAGLRNFADTDQANPASLDASDFAAGRPNADHYARTFFTNTMLSTGTVIAPPNNPGLYPGVLIVADNTYATMTTPAHLKRHANHFIGTNSDNKPFADPANAGNNLYPHIPLDNNEFQATLGVPAPAPVISTLRIADMLMPMAIGPEFDPGANPPAIPAGQSIPVDRCMTLGESLALALNYSNPPATGDPFSIYAGIGSSAPPVPPAQASLGALDRGHLSLSRFCPFEDVNANGVYDRPPQGNDKSRWPGIPLALNILNTFRTIDPQYGSLTRPIIGQVNINTASLPVLRGIPLLSPSTDTSSLPASAGTEWNAYKTLAGFTAADRPLPDIDSDIAAALKAYRDKSLEYTRDAAAPNTDTFEDTTPNPFVTTGADGRNLTTLIPGIREGRGIGSLGEIMAITTSPTSTTNRLRPRDRIDMTGNDNRQSGTAGTLSVMAHTTTGAKTLDEIADDYHEKLIVAQGVLNTVSVRSDVFAIWFVVHGYQKSDTEGLGVNDPLVPSIAKRYLLILDRSNVTRAGEKAKVLLFKEVPM